jgi:hypothetical protein
LTLVSDISFLFFCLGNSLIGNLLIGNTIVGKSLWEHHCWVMNYDELVHPLPQELDQMRMAHARVVSERRRSSIGLTGRGGGGGRRESTLYSIVEHDSPRQAAATATATSTTQTPTVHLITRKEATLETEKAVKAALVSAASGNTSRVVGEEEEDVEARIEARIEKAVVDAVATTVCAKEEELRRAVEALEGTLEEQQREFQKRLQRMQAKQKSDLKDFKDLEKSQSTTAAALANAADEALVKEQQYVTPCGRGLLLRWLHWCGDA